ncbi:hypothetical protein U9M48_035137 [Paspalum notatum var. saurae]|uniref:40S ribosomal protein S7 n=2 Tax=Paspalum notatum var. saurae TaxID=547442 RepID=A0AAQ3UEL4_PASNO
MERGPRSTGAATAVERGQRRRERATRRCRNGRRVGAPLAPPPCSRPVWAGTAHARAAVAAGGAGSGTSGRHDRSAVVVVIAGGSARGVGAADECEDGVGAILCGTTLPPLPRHHPPPTRRAHPATRSPTSRPAATESSSAPGKAERARGRGGAEAREGGGADGEVESEKDKKWLCHCHVGPTATCHLTGCGDKREGKMYTARKKIQKEKGLEPSEFEDSVAQAFFDLENGNQELKSDLKDLYINNAIQMDVAGSRKAVVIHVPYRLRKAFRKIHVKLVRELEKKFSGKDVVVVATRRIVRPPKKGSAVQRPRTRTLTAVHDGILEDVVYPAEIVGKRVRYHLDGAKVIKIFLDPKERNNTEYKLETFTAVYRRLCGKDVVFEYPVAENA